MEKYEWRKKDKSIYLATKKPNLLKIPKYKYYVIEGFGNPNSLEFSEKISALYSLSYGIRMSYKTENIPKGYYQYTVFPLEGIWDLIDHSKNFSIDDKDNLKYKIMIRQPDFVTREYALENIQRVKSKSFNKYHDLVRFEELDEGLVVQALHIGSFDTEEETIKIIEKFLLDNNLERTTKIHKEIYLSDFRRTKEENLKTTLRVYVKEK